MKIKKNICNKIKEINKAGGFVQLTYVLHFRYYFRGQNNEVCSDFQKRKLRKFP